MMCDNHSGAIHNDENAPTRNEFEFILFGCHVTHVSQERRTHRELWLPTN